MQYFPLQIDVARNFHSKETILRFLDVMGQYKLNRFHFHLSDDEGWRLQFDAFPQLTQVHIELNVIFKLGPSLD